MNQQEKLKKYIEDYSVNNQGNTEQYTDPCPRCGLDKMSENPIRDALSRQANVKICSDCGMDEALRDYLGKEPLPFEDWAIIKYKAL